MTKQQRMPATTEAKMAQRNKRDLDRLLDESLEATFPASDPVAILQPAAGAAGSGWRDEEPGPQDEKAE